MPSRKFHHKNRHGCRNCRSRRKKCGLERPGCRECAKRMDYCVYDLSLNSTTSTIAVVPQSVEKPLASPWSTLDARIQSVLSAGIPHIGMADIELMQNLRWNHSIAFNSMPALHPIRNLDLVKKAPDYPYLLHGLLAASALYLRFQATSEHQPLSRVLWYEEQAIDHHQRALSSYKSRLESIDEKTCHFIFGFSVMLAGLELALLKAAKPEQTLMCDTVLDDIIKIFGLLQGSVAVANASSAWIPICRSKPLRLPGKASYPDNDQSTRGATASMLNNLSTAIHIAQTVENSKCLGDAVMDISVIHNSAIPELINVYQSLQRAKSDSFLSVIAWPAFVDKAFILLLNGRHPAALVVLAYYGVALHALEQAWWLRGVGARIVGSLSTIMSACHTEEWQKLLEWPQEVVKQTRFPSDPGSFFSPWFSADIYSHEIRTPFETALVHTQTMGITE